ncbi:MAG: DUF6261 family protein [Prevotellaceae bacterium]|jgi:hypothetical protein|nr:DUF6261 family protein [Prevotellaceae bacterium]
MKHIESAHLHYYRNEAHYEFAGEFRGLLNRFPSAGTLLSTLIPEFDGIYAREGELVDRMRKSDVTEQLAETDRLIDRYVTGIRENVAAGMRHFDPVVVEAATSLNNRLKAFGKIERKAFEEESAAVKLLIEEFQSPEYAHKVDIVGIAPWVTKLAETESVFNALFDLRNAELADRPDGQTKEVRQELDTVYHRMTDRIDAAATLDESGVYSEFIRQLNGYITYFNEHTHQHAKKDVKNANTDAIPVQQATGAAITPIPVVYLEGKELTFAADFNLTYKNNVKPGTATLIIHGKGAYRGRKEVTFNIVES